MADGMAISPVYSSIIGAIALFIASGYVYWSEGRQPYALVWALAWGVYILRFVAEEIFLYSAQPMARLLLHNLLLLNASFLLSGTLLLIQDSNLRWRWLRIGQAGAMVVVLTYILFPWPIVQDMLAFVVTGLSNVISGGLLLRDKSARPPLRLAGWILIIWGTHKLDYVPVHLYFPSLVPHGYLLSGALSLLLAGCLFALPIDAARERQVQSLKDVVFLIAATLEARDTYTANHSHRVALLAREVALGLEIPPSDCEQIYFAGLLHDIGKIAVSESILHKPGPLSSEEYAQIKQHPVIAAQILARAEHVFGKVIPAVRHHHEWWEGKGYPDGLMGENIPLGARSLAVADALEAIVSDRPYRPGRPAEEALEEVIKCAGTQFCPQVVAGLLKCWTQIKNLL